MSNAHGTAGTIGSSAHRPRDRKTTKTKEKTEKHSPAHEELYSPPERSLSTVIFFALLAAALYMGWQIRDEGILTPKAGLGYFLGIVGGLMMMGLVLYPIRKKKRSMHRLGKARAWFRAHMFLGILGPVFVVFHANFHLGSFNSRVVLAATLLVTASGFVGLYIYTKIHNGLYGRRKTLEDMLEESKLNTCSLIGILGEYAPKRQERLMALHARVSTPTISFLQSAWRLHITGFWIRWNKVLLYRSLKRSLNVTARREGWSRREKRRIGKIARRNIADYLFGILNIAEFSFFERLFALWSLFHYPLFILLIITGVVHVIAVHMF
jgi:hypothetical protein